MSLAYRQAQKGAAKGKAKVEQPGSDSGSDDSEAQYERTPRQRVQDKQDSQKAVLPTKSLQGELVYAKNKADNSMSRLQVHNAPMVISTVTAGIGHLLEVSMPDYTNYWLIWHKHVSSRGSAWLCCHAPCKPMYMAMLATSACK